ncbi:DUF4296 domain-containing protein [Flavobacteriaceae bacterium]|nr:DUF4296 domain-containing protein [Flavobacteriaceae bacterium]
MKFNYFFLNLICSGLFLGSCSGTGFVEKPDNLISKNKMEAILYDAIIMDVMSTFSEKNPNFENLMGKSYLYKKYGIDSIQLVESENYYAKKPREYLKIHASVLKRFEFVKDSLDRLSKSIKTN